MTVQRRNAMRWLFGGLTLAFLSWAAGRYDLVDSIYDPRIDFVVSNTLHWLVRTGSAMIAGGLAALWGGYRWATAPPQSN